MIPKKFKLRITYSKKEKDFVIHYPRKSDGGLLQSAILGKMTHYFLSHTAVNDNEKKKGLMKFVENSSSVPSVGWYQWDWLKELAERGYDLSTFKMEITIDLNRLNTDFPHLWEELTPKEKKDLAKLGMNLKNSSD